MTFQIRLGSNQAIISIILIILNYNPLVRELLAEQPDFLLTRRSMIHLTPHCTAWGGHGSE